MRLSTGAQLDGRTRAVIEMPFGAPHGGAEAVLNARVNDRRGRFFRPIVSIVDILSGATPLIVDVRQTGSSPVPKLLDRGVRQEQDRLWVGGFSLGWGEEGGSGWRPTSIAVSSAESSSET